MDAAAWKIVSIAGYSLAGVLFITAILMFFRLRVLAIIGDLSGRTAARQIQEIRDRNKLTGTKLHKPDVFNLERGELTTPVEKKTGRMGRPSGSPSSKKLNEKGQTVSTSMTTVLERPLEGETVILEPGMAVLNAGVLEQGTAVLDAGTGVLDQGTEVLETDVFDQGTAVLGSGNGVLNQGTAVLANGTEVLEQGTSYLGSGTAVLDQTGVPGSGTEVHNRGTEVLDCGIEVLAEENGTTVLNAETEFDGNGEAEIQEVAFKLVKDIKVIHTNEKI